MRPVHYTDGPFPRQVIPGTDYGPNEWIEGTYRNHTFEPIGYIPQVPHTYSYHVANYGLINEHNVGMGESTCSAMFYTCARGDTRHCTPGMTNGVALLSINELTALAMERARSAREAIEIMGGLAYEHGFYGTHDANGDGEALQVGDPTEAWTFHILADPTGTRAIWAAVRVPDENVTVLANMFTIREVDTNDKANVMASPNLYSVAEERGWWRPGEVFDFTKIYSNGEYGNKYYSGRRTWRGLSLIAPSLHLPPEYDDLRYFRGWPWSAKPDKLVTPSDFRRWYRDYLQGTEFDLTKGAVAGYGGTPDRFALQSEATGGWERSIALYRTNCVNICHLRKTTEARPAALAGVLWYAMGPAHYSPFLPVPSGTTRTLKPFFDYSPTRVAGRDLNWPARRAMMACQVRFDRMHPVVESWQAEVEGAGDTMLARLEAQYSASDLNDAVEANVESALERWNGLADELLFRFSDNNDVTRSRPIWRKGVGSDSQIAGLNYPSEWLAAVGFDDFKTQLPPQEMQCPPTCPGESAPERLGSYDLSQHVAESHAWPIFASYVLVSLSAFLLGRASNCPRRRLPSSGCDYAAL